MTGPEHYKEAERLLALVNNVEIEAHPEIRALRLAEAQVHATLAGVALRWDVTREQELTRFNRLKWRETFA